MPDQPEPEKVVDALLGDPGNQAAAKDYARQVESSHRYRFYSYDVWGNAEEGYEVNDVFETSETIEIPDAALQNDAALFKHLVEIGFLTGKKLKVYDFSTDGDEEIIYLEYRDKPSGELRRLEVGEQ